MGVMNTQAKTWNGSMGKRPGTISPQPVCQTPLLRRKKNEWGKGGGGTKHFVQGEPLTIGGGGGPVGEKWSKKGVRKTKREQA